MLPQQTRLSKSPQLLLIQWVIDLRFHLINIRNNEGVVDWVQFTTFKVKFMVSFTKGYIVSDYLKKTWTTEYCI